MCQKCLVAAESFLGNAISLGFSMFLKHFEQGRRLSETITKADSLCAISRRLVIGKPPYGTSVEQTASKFATAFHGSAWAGSPETPSVWDAFYDVESRTPRGLARGSLGLELSKPAHFSTAGGKRTRMKKLEARRFDHRTTLFLSRNSTVRSGSVPNQFSFSIARMMHVDSVSLSDFRSTADGTATGALFSMMYYRSLQSCRFRSDAIRKGRFFRPVPYRVTVGRLA